MYRFVNLTVFLRILSLDGIWVAGDEQKPITNNQYKSEDSQYYSEEDKSINERLRIMYEKERERKLQFFIDLRTQFKEWQQESKQPGVASFHDDPIGHEVINGASFDMRMKLMLKNERDFALKNKIAYNKKVAAEIREGHQRLHVHLQQMGAIRRVDSESYDSLWVYTYVAAVITVAYPTVMCFIYSRDRVREKID